MRSPAMSGSVPASETFDDVVDRRLARRSVLKGVLGVAPLLVVGPSVLFSREAAAAPAPHLTFQPIALDDGIEVRVPEGYIAQKFLRWGDPILPGAPAFDFWNQSATAQAGQFGYNCDFLQFFPLPQDRVRNGSHGILAVNHEYTNPELMFADFIAADFEGNSPSVTTQANVDIELAAHGLSLVEVRLDRQSGWEFARQSQYNRRITAETWIAITGPAAGHDLLKVSYDPTGTLVRGTLNNCGGGITPWGTLLTAEENFNQYFANRALVADPSVRAIHARYGLPNGISERGWEQHHSRFDLAQEPNEPFRFGWIVEIDPYTPDWIPRKRSALGRLKHEAATVVVSRAGRAVVYSGDDERFEHIYKFVSSGRVSPRREENVSLLDDGVLYAARFDVDGDGQGVGVWRPLIGGQGPLEGWTQADVLINTREAARLMGATRMDRPEDLQTDPRNGKLYCALTNNTRRTPVGLPGEVAANPRAPNKHGHVIELTEDGADPGASTFTWEIFVLCGDPDNPADAPVYFAGFDPSKVSPISSPDNVTFDRRGNLWIATDGQINTFGKNDGIYAVPVDGDERGYLRQFLSGVPGGEVASLALTPDDQTLFASIQHPAEGSTIAAPTHRWPDGDVPRPTVVAVRKVAPGAPEIGS